MNNAEEKKDDGKSIDSNVLPTIIVASVILIISISFIFFRADRAQRNTEKSHGASELVIEKPAVENAKVSEARRLKQAKDFYTCFSLNADKSKYTDKAATHAYKVTIFNADGSIRNSLIAETVRYEHGYVKALISDPYISGPDSWQIIVNECNIKEYMFEADFKFANSSFTQIDEWVKSITAHVCGIKK